MSVYQAPRTWTAVSLGEMLVLVLAIGVVAVIATIALSGTALPLAFDLVPDPAGPNVPW